MQMGEIQKAKAEGVAKATPQAESLPHRSTERVHGLCGPEFELARRVQLILPGFRPAE
jgi:hypothetical protein